jgi:hypothetical protein
MQKTPLLQEVFLLLPYYAAHGGFRFFEFCVFYTAVDAAFFIP